MKIPAKDIFLLIMWIINLTVILLTLAILFYMVVGDIQ